MNFLNLLTMLLKWGPTVTALLREILKLTDKLQDSAVKRTAVLACKRNAKFAVTRAEAKRKQKGFRAAKAELKEELRKERNELRSLVGHA